MTNTTVDREAVLASYLAFWNTDPGSEQTRLAAEAFTADVGYHAVIDTFIGIEQLLVIRPQFVEHLGDIRIVSRGPADQHHDRARLRWELRLPDQTSFAEGTDVIRFADDGRIAEITVFLDRAPEGFDAHH